jgi:hypothetical protein
MSKIILHITSRSPVKVNGGFERKDRLKRRALLGICFMLVACLAYFRALEMKAIFSFETSVELHGSTRLVSRKM